jgi:hypothetical protein
MARRQGPFEMIWLWEWRWGFAPLVLARVGELTQGGARSSRCALGYRLTGLWPSL